MDTLCDLATFLDFSARCDIISPSLRIRLHPATPRSPPSSCIARVSYRRSRWLHSAVFVVMFVGVHVALCLVCPGCAYDYIIIVIM